MKAQLPRKNFLFIAESYNLFYLKFFTHGFAEKKYIITTRNLKA